MNEVADIIDGFVWGEHKGYKKQCSLCFGSWFVNEEEKHKENCPRLVFVLNRRKRK